MGRAAVVAKPATLILFDIDGTLLLSGGAGRRALNRAFHELFGVAAGFDEIPVAGRTDRLIFDDALARAGVEVRSERRERFHARYYHLLEQEILSPGPRKGLMPGVRSLLDELAAHPDLTCGLLTGNFARAAEIKLEYFDLWRYFVCGAYGDDAPDRDALVPVAVDRARRRGIAVRSTANVVVVGDTPLDIQCARAAGARSVAVATGVFDEASLQAHGADAVFPDLTNVPAFIDLLAGNGRTLSEGEDHR